FFVITGTTMIIGAVCLILFQLNPGIDFTSGSRVEVMSDNTLTEEEIEAEINILNVEPKSIVFSGENNEIAVMRYDTVLSESEIATLSDHFIEQYGHEPNVS